MGTLCPTPTVLPSPITVDGEAARRRAGREADLLHTLARDARRRCGQRVAGASDNVHLIASAARHRSSARHAAAGSFHVHAVDSRPSRVFHRDRGPPASRRRPNRATRGPANRTPTWRLAQVPERADREPTLSGSFGPLVQPVTARPTRSNQARGEGFTRFGITVGAASLSERAPRRSASRRR